MKKIISTLALGLLSAGAFAQAQGITYGDEYISIDLNEACYKQGNLLSCDLNKYGVGLVLTGTCGIQEYSSKSKCTTLTSSIPIGRVEFGTPYGDTEIGVWTGNTLSGKGYNSSRVQDFGNPGETSVIFNATYGTYPTKVHLRTGIPSYLKDGLSGSGRLLRTSYAGVLRNLTAFKTEIAKSHRGHLDRFMTAIQTGITLLDAQTKDKKPLYSILDWRVQENARLVVVFGTVLDELLRDYDDVERLKTSIKAMRVLVEQLRGSYGWDKGLAGSVSKASSSLIEVVRLELQELASIKMAVGATDFQIYLDLLKITRTLQAKVDASKSGDMKAQRDIFTMLDLWNSKAWQDEMDKLLNAGPDLKNLVVPKLSMLIFAIESISDLSDQEFILPNREALNK